MNRQQMYKSQRWILTLIVATTLALTMTFGQGVAGKIIGADWAPAAYACQGEGSGC